MFNFGLKYHNHKENHYAKDTQHSVKKEVIKNGRCLKHQDIIITRLGGLFTKECKRCAEEYKLNVETKINTTQIIEEPTQIIEEPIQTIEEPMKIIEEPMKTIEELTQTIDKKEENQNMCNNCNRQKYKKFHTCCQACITGSHTKDCNYRNNYCANIKERIKEPKPSKERKQIIKESKQTQNKQIDTANAAMREFCRHKNAETQQRKKDILNNKYPLLTKITDKCITLNDITYTLCEVKVLKHSWIPTSEILTEHWIKYKHNNVKKIDRRPVIKCNQVAQEIYDNTETEYIVDLKRFRYVCDSAYTFYNGAYILSEGVSCINPTYYIVNGEIIQIPSHMNDIRPTVSNPDWYTISHLNCKKVLDILLK
jgi:hypothetical protein